MNEQGLNEQGTGEKKKRVFTNEELFERSMRKLLRTAGLLADAAMRCKPDEGYEAAELLNAATGALAFVTGQKREALERFFQRRAPRPTIAIDARDNDERKAIVRAAHKLFDLDADGPDRAKLFVLGRLLGYDVADLEVRFPLQAEGTAKQA